MKRGNKMMNGLIKLTPKNFHSKEKYMPGYERCQKKRTDGRTDG